ncbi:MAG: SpoIIE family protein phosphatase [Sporolactobacillus sp.]
MLNYENRLNLYEDILSDYLTSDGDAQVAFRGRLLSRIMLEHGVPPDEVLKMHLEAFKTLREQDNQKFNDSFDLLLDIMAGYRNAFQEMKDLKDRQRQLDWEITVAADMQQTLLEGSVPDYPYADIGAVTEPAKKMSGDYYQFVESENRSIGIALADIVGKGIPAAMCMSMIKYAMDSLPENRQDPRIVLASLNRVVERNVDPSMFVTMFYGSYNPEKRVLTYSSAGHEPGLYYSASEHRFIDMQAKGLALGLTPGTRYPQYSLQLAPGDMIFLFTDGVTESRTKHGFVGRQKLIQMLEKHLNLSAKKIVERTFYELEKLQDFELRDDFTFITMKF